ncbi:hypothetical protein Fmac_018807 [Flemingia macrophylla]|uniref:Uncharacterized protein n=1 Tax=Flemingia macrophylla TaxID=520843 RepID=A0ABD1M622_9FABA
MTLIALWCVCSSTKLEYKIISKDLSQNSRLTNVNTFGSNRWFLIKWSQASGPYGLLPFLQLQLNESHSYVKDGNGSHYPHQRLDRFGVQFRRSDNEKTSTSSSTGVGKPVGRPPTFSF